MFTSFLPRSLLPKRKIRLSGSDQRRNGRFGRDYGRAKDDGEFFVALGPPCRIDVTTLNGAVPVGRDIQHSTINIWRNSTITCREPSVRGALSWQMSGGVCVGRVELPRHENIIIIILGIIIIIIYWSPIIGLTACRLQSPSFAWAIGNQTVKLEPSARHIPMD